MSTCGTLAFPRSSPNPTPSSSRCDPIRPVRSPKRAKATPSPSSPVRPRLPTSSTAGLGSRHKVRSGKTTPATSLDSRKTVTSPTQSPNKPQRWDWPPRRREMSVPLVSHAYLSSVRKVSTDTASYRRHFQTSLYHKHRQHFPRQQRSANHYTTVLHHPTLRQPASSLPVHHASHPAGSRIHRSRIAVSVSP